MYINILVISLNNARQNDLNTNQQYFDILEKWTKRHITIVNDYIQFQFITKIFGIKIYLGIFC